MYKSRLQIWFFLLVWLCFCFESKAQTLVFRNFTVNHGLASSTVYSILQDSKGFIWFGTESGVNRFDGKNFELFTIDNGLSDNEVLQIEEDSKGKIWFLTLNGKLSYYHRNKFHNPDNDKLLRNIVSNGSFVSFYEDSKHHLWFSTNQNKLFEISENHVRIHSSDKFSLTNAFIYENRSAQIAAINKDQLLILNHGKFVKQKLAELPISPKAIQRNPDKSITFLSKTGLINYNHIYTHVLNYLTEEIASTAPGTFIIDKKNNVWIGSMGNGLFRIKPDHAIQNTLNSNIITDILQDWQGNLWVSTIGNGVNMLRANAQSTLHYTAADGLNSTAIHSVLKIKDQVILGLRNGKIDILKNGKITHPYIQHSEYNPVKQLFYDKENGSVWFAAHNKLAEINLKTAELNYVKELHHGAYAMKNFSLSRSGKIAMALASGVYLIENKNKALVFNSKQTPFTKRQYQNRAFSVFYDSAERLWIANVNGLYCNYQSACLYQNTDHLSQRITDIAELPDKTIVCSTLGYGILVIKDFKRIKVINTQNGLLSNICKKIYIDKHTGWFVTGKGISKIDFNNHEKVTNFGTENGLITSEVNDLFIENDTVYAATNRGLSIISGKQTWQNHTVPRLYVYSFLANKKVVDTDTTINLPYQKNNITVNYIALDFGHPGFVKYSYKLNPELKWNETSNNSIEFASLQPGTYQLHIRAKGISSNWGQPVQITFTINSPFWKTWWFILLSILSISLFAFNLINQYYKTRRATENERLLTRTKIISLEQQALQAMMNPHFVFNVMNSIQYFINTKDHAMANQALTGFARLLRKNLEICNKSYITIEEEVTYLNLYLSLEKMRFGERMEYKINVDAKIKQSETFIPSMLLQPFVENAIWHGIMPKEENGNIWINISLHQPEILEIEIKDNGIGIDNSLKEKTEGHISRGMQLTTERIKLLNKFKQNPIQMDIKQLALEGTLISIKIPFQPFTH